MRIIAGKLGGRNFDSPHGKRTHPMSDKVRGALFNILGDIQGLSVLDAFAGSGALGFEALSRGAGQVLAIEIDAKAQKTIASNAKTLDAAGQFKLVRANCSSWSDTNPANEFDIVLAAPPYDDLQLPVVEKLSRHVAKGGLYVLDWPGKTPAPDLPSLTILNQKNYGDAQLVFYESAV
jgi:16S rRNA (guanine966-N2)-methyltransferase